MLDACNCRPVIKSVVAQSPNLINRSIGRLFVGHGLENANELVVQIQIKIGVMVC